MLDHLEHHHQPLLPLLKYYLRVVRYGSVSLILVVFSLGIGILGYHYFGGLAWLDSLVNASMLLGGMGPVNPVTTVAGKWFISFYALFSGIIFLFSFSILLAPIVHRFLHRFHLEQGGRNEDEG